VTEGLPPVHDRHRQRNAKALTPIVDDLLDIARIMGGSIRIDPLPVDLVAVIQAHSMRLGRLPRGRP
jgi:signal transduction histidine kinase